MPRSANPNLHAQHGLFTLYRPNVSGRSGLPRVKAFEMVLERLPWMRSGPDVLLFRFTLPISEAPKLLRLLAKEGVSGCTLFPGFDGAALALREEQLWDHRYVAHFGRGNRLRRAAR